MRNYNSKLETPRPAPRAPRSCREQAGFALFISLLVASIVLSVGFGVADIMFKELKLSGLGQESQIAFYAADAGIECFLYWEEKHPGTFDGLNNINCAGNTISNNFKTDTKTSNFNVTLSENSCVSVKVDKSSGTTVESKGYNTKYCDSNSPFKVERAIKLILQ